MAFSTIRSSKLSIGAMRQRNSCSIRKATSSYATSRSLSAAPAFVRHAGANGRPSRAVSVASAAVTDPVTKLSFQEESGGLQCVGAGVREKKIAFISVKVYSVALYVDAAAAKAALASGATLLKGAFDKELVIKLARSVDGPTFWGALDEALMPRIAQIATEQATKEDADGNFMSTMAEAAEEAEAAARDAAKTLGTFLSRQKLDTGVEVSLRCSPDGNLTASVTGAASQNYKSPELCQAILDIYLGSDPISPSALKAFQEGAASL